MKTWFFLRGLVRESGHWSGFLEKFKASMPDVAVVPIELPGNGARFRESSPTSIGAMAAVARGEFLKHRTEENYLFALSMGGMVGLEWMKNWPKDFQAAVLVNTSVRGLSPLYYRLQPRNYPRILRILLSNNPEFVERTILEMTSHNQSRFKELTEDWARIQKERPVSAINALKQIIAASRFLPSGEKPSVPILLLNGAGDHLVNPACSRALAENWNLPLRVHPTAGHDLTLDEPEWVLEQVRDWQK